MERSDGVCADLNRLNVVLCLTGAATGEKFEKLTQFKESPFWNVSFFFVRQTNPVGTEANVVECTRASRYIASEGET